MNANHVLGLKRSFYEGTFVQNIKSFVSAYTEWLIEMKENVRSLDLYKIESGSHPFDIIPNTTPKSVHSIKKDFYLFYDRLNSAAQKINRSQSTETDFLKMFYQATDRLVSEKINF